MSTWSYVKNGEKQGPVEVDQIKKLIASKVIPPSVLVWKNGMSNWVAANTLSEFSVPTPPSESIPVPAEATVLTGEEDVEAHKVFAIMSYLGILFIVPIIAVRQSKFAIYHANQGMVLFICVAIVWMGSIFFGFFLAFIPLIGNLITLMLMPIYGILGLCWFVFMVLGIVHAAQGAFKPLPIVGEKFTLIK